MDDDFLDEKSETGSDGKEGDKSEAEERGGKSKKPRKKAGGSAKKKAAQVQVVKECLVPPCKSSFMKGSKFCKLHKRSADIMYYQAQAQSEEAMKVVKDKTAIENIFADLAIPAERRLSDLDPQAVAITA